MTELPRKKVPGCDCVLVLNKRLPVLWGFLWRLLGLLMGFRLAAPGSLLMVAGWTRTRGQRWLQAEVLKVVDLTNLCSAAILYGDTAGQSLVTTLVTSRIGHRRVEERVAARLADSIGFLVVGDLHGKGCQSWRRTFWKDTVLCLPVSLPPDSNKFIKHDFTVAASLCSPSRRTFLSVHGAIIRTLRNPLEMTSQ